MKRIMITGASRGIGRSIATKLARKENHLLLHGRDGDALKAVLAEVTSAGATAELCPADLSDNNQTIALAQQVSSEKLDVLINNAAGASTQPAVEINLDEWEKTFRVNVTAPFLLTKLIAPKMNAGCSIVNILSGAAYTGYPNWSAYCMSKFALDGFSKAVREELRPAGIRVINIYPGSTDTDIWENIPGQFDRSKMMSPDSVAETVVMALDQPDGVLVEGVRITNLNSIG